MFGEAESESPRVPSPWDSLISTPSSGTSPSSSREASPPLDLQSHPDHPTLIPRLVPENDEGNVEYKLQLLNPSPARFARLVTQLKWRLLEGGGQAYYELGVADSGALVGLPRAQLEQSLETLEMMAGEIGASVIVVKEVEVPAYMADIAASETERERWKGSGRRKKRGHGNQDAATSGGENGTDSSTAAPSSWSTTTETETSTGTDLDDDEEDDLSTTVVLQKNSGAAAPMNGSPPRIVHINDAEDLDDPANAADAEDDEPKPRYPAVAVDLEIATVFKPRPMRARTVHPPANGPNAPGGGKQKRMKKIKHIIATHPPANANVGHTHELHGHLHAHGHEHNKAHHVPPKLSKAENRRVARDRRREERRRALVSAVEDTLPASTTSPTAVNGTHVASADTTHLVEDLSNLHVSLTAETVAEDNFVHISTSETVTSSLAVSAPNNPTETANDNQDVEDDDDDDVFPLSPPTTAKPPFISLSDTVKKLSSSGDGTQTPNGEDAEESGEITGNRLIVEALVVRKMSLDEGFLDFGGFALI